MIYKYKHVSYKKQHSAIIDVRTIKNHNSDNYTSYLFLLSANLLKRPV